jgi:hypothetical protein
MDRPELLAYLEGLDNALRAQATLYIYGSAACILLGEPDRTSLDVDVAGPYSDVDQGDLRYLLTQGAVDIADVEAAVTRLPVPFALDPLVRENLHNLKADMEMWRGGLT